MKTQKTVSVCVCLKTEHTWQNHHYRVDLSRVSPNFRLKTTHRHRQIGSSSGCPEPFTSAMRSTGAVELHLAVTVGEAKGLTLVFQDIHLRMEER